MISSTQGGVEVDPHLSSVLRAVIQRGQADDWKGHDKHDGLNSPLVASLFGWSRPTRLLALQCVMRSPVNLRSLLRVPAVENPKGIALFLQSLVSTWRLTGTDADLALIHELVARLDRLRSSGGEWTGRAWGYQYPWQDLGFFAPSGTPNAVVSSFVCEALLDVHAATGSRQSIAMVADALPFFREDLPRLVDDRAHLCVAYMPMPMTMRVMDVSALVGALYARVHKVIPGQAPESDSARLVEYVVDQQTTEGAWWYTDPPGASPVRIDNYHTGFILDALWRYMDFTGDTSLMESYRKGLRFYADNLFERDGAPRWMSDQRYPHDVHGCAQGVITFCRHAADYPGLAERIAQWALANLYDGDGRFWYRRTKRRTDRRFFLRWNNAWMARAISDLLLYRAGQARTDGEQTLLRHFQDSSSTAAGGNAHA